MNILLNKKAYEVEIIAYLKVFYPLEDIKINEDEQPMMVIDVKQLSIRVAYLMEKKNAYLANGWQNFKRLKGKNKTDLVNHVLRDYYLNCVAKQQVLYLHGGGFCLV